MLWQQGEVGWDLGWRGEVSSAGCWLAASPLVELPWWFHPLCEHLDPELFSLALRLPRDPCRFPCLSLGDDKGSRRAWRDSLQLCGAGVAARRHSVCLGTWETSNTRPRGTSGVKGCFSLHGCYFCSITGSWSGVLIGKSVDSGFVERWGKVYFLPSGKKFFRN